LVVDGLEQSRRGEAGAVAERFELDPDHALGDPAHAGRGVEAAVGTGLNAPGIADRARDPLKPLGDHLGGARRSW
jgi:hypothetical protein